MPKADLAPPPTKTTETDPPSGLKEPEPNKRHFPSPDAGEEKAASKLNGTLNGHHHEAETPGIALVDRPSESEPPTHIERSANKQAAQPKPALSDSADTTPSPAITPPPASAPENPKMGPFALRRVLNPAQDIPLTMFSGHLRQMALETIPDDLLGFFHQAFSRTEAGDIHPEAANVFVSERSRRFSGGPGLQPFSYHAVCEDESFDDQGACRDDLLAYYSGHGGIIADLFDSELEPGIVDFLKDSGHSPEALAERPFHFVNFRQQTPQSGLTWQQGAIIPSRRNLVQIEKTIDLRLPSTQDWFVKSFVGLEINANPVYDRQRPESFEDLLPLICHPSLGGSNIFTQAIGQWLRKHGVEALIYPSARANPNCGVGRTGIDMFKGWTLVSYMSASPIEDVNLFGRVADWRDPLNPLRVAFKSDGDTRGSLALRGGRELNLLRYDFEKQIAVGMIEAGYPSQKGISQALSSHGSQILDREAAHGDIFSGDVDYLDFINFHEQRWMPQEG